MRTIVFTILLGCALVCGCDDDAGTATCGPGTQPVGTTCQPDAQTVLECGAGTVLDDGECVPENNLGCGAGTFESDGQCLPVDPDPDTTAPITTPDKLGGEILDGAAVTLSANEPALIYFSIDGSDPGPGGRAAFSPAVVPIAGVDEADVTLRYYAVDAAGNQEAVKQNDFTRITLFDPVTDFDVALTGDDAAITWTAPVGAAGTLVVRVAGPLTGGPVHGETYAVGQTLPGGHEVVFAGSGNSLAQPDLTPGLAHYAAWAYSDTKYSRPRADMEVVPLPPQTGSASVDVAAAMATVTSPSRTAVSATATYAAPNLTLSVAVQNNTTRALYNPKVLFSNLSTGSVTNADGTLGSTPYLYLDAALLPGATVTRDVVIDGVGESDTVTFDLEVRDHPMLLPPSRTATGDFGDRFAGIVDTGTDTVAGRTAEAELPRIDGIGPGGAATHITGALALDGQHIYIGHRHAARVALMDIARLTVVQNVVLASERGTVRQLVADPARDVIYALVTLGRHAYSTNGNVPLVAARVLLVKLDGSSLLELGRVELAPVDVDGVHVLGRSLAVSPDGSRVAVGIVDTSVAGSLHLVDAETMLEVDINGAAAGNGLNTGSSDSLYPGSLVFAPDGSRLYAGNIGPVGRLAVIDTATFAIATHVPSSGDLQRASVMQWGPGGLLFVGGGQGSLGLHTFDPLTSAFLKFGTDTGEVLRFAFKPSGEIYVAHDNETIRLLDASGDFVSSAAADGRRGEMLLITPY